MPSNQGVKTIQCGQQTSFDWDSLAKQFIRTLVIAELFVTRCIRWLEKVGKPVILTFYISLTSKYMFFLLSSWIKIIAFWQVLCSSLLFIVVFSELYSNIIGILHCKSLICTYSMKVWFTYFVKWLLQWV